MPDLVQVIALRHLGVERKLFTWKVKGHDFYVNLSHHKKLNTHISWHESGEFHYKVRYAPELPRQTRRQLGPPAKLKGVALVCHIVCGVGVPFIELKPIPPGQKHLVMIDAEVANFRDAPFFARVYLVEPGQQHQIPIAPGTGPRIVHVVERTTAPWLAAEVFQQAVVGLHV
jgi:hypothetical protein